MLQQSIASDDISQALTSDHAPNGRGRARSAGERALAKRSATVPGFVRAESTQHAPLQPPAASFELAAPMSAWVRLLRASGRWLHTHFEQRRSAASMRHDLGAMNERELLDIGLTRADVHGSTYPALDQLLHRM